MTQNQAINSLISSCNDYAQLVEILKKENEFLAETIIKSNLNEIREERRSLYRLIEQKENDCKEIFDNNEIIKKQYLIKSNELHSKLIELEKKQLSVDSYIEDESNKKVDLEKQKLKKEFDLNLQKLLLEKDEKTDVVISRIKKRNKILIVITIVSLIFSLCSLLFLVL